MIVRMKKLILIYFSAMYFECKCQRHLCIDKIYGDGTLLTGSPPDSLGAKWDQVDTACYHHVPYVFETGDYLLSEYGHNSF